MADYDDALSMPTEDNIVRLTEALRRAEAERDAARADAEREDLPDHSDAEIIAALKADLAKARAVITAQAANLRECRAVLRDVLPWAEKYGVLASKSRAAFISLSILGLTRKARLILEGTDANEKPDV